MALTYVFLTVVDIYSLYFIGLALYFVSLTSLLLIFSLRLFVETIYRKKWGATVLILYGLGFYAVVILFNFASIGSSYSPVYALDLVALVLYILGPIGGVWGLLSKTWESQSRPPPNVNERFVF